MNFVTASLNAGERVTVKLHCAVRELASVAVHVTVVVPVENVVPDAGAHATETGCVPLAIEGGG